MIVARALSVLVLVAAPSAQEEFVPLFNGQDLTGWRTVNCAPSTWTVADGMIVCSGFPTGVLRTERQYENFVFEVEWRHLSAGGNAGIFVWSDPLTARGQPFTRSVEVQVMDGREDTWYTSDGDVFPIHGATMVPENGRGGMRAFPTEKRMKPSPEWNHYAIRCENGEISLAVNGKVVTKGAQCSPRKGYICLESEGSLCHFRNLRIAELPPSNPPLAAEHVAALATGHESLFNGSDFTGWRHGPEHEGHWTVADWRIDFDGAGPDLWSEREFGDFELICDWRWSGEATPTRRPVILPDGSVARDENGAEQTVEVADAGDSGIYLRGSSKSQVNIWCWPIGSGEVYGYRTDSEMPAAVRRGVTPTSVADAPIGNWNRFVITMIGEHLTVDLNGTRVLDRARLPGVAARGPIALQNHGAPLQFANIYVKDLDPGQLVGTWRGTSANAEGWLLELRSEGKGTWQAGPASFDVDYAFDPTASPMSLDLSGFETGLLQGKTLFGIVEISDGVMRWDANPGDPEQPRARPAAFDSAETRSMRRN